MKNYFLFILLAVLAAGLLGCSRCQNKEIMVSPFVEAFLADYDYTLTDTSGNKLIDGTIVMKVYEEPEFTGTYTRRTSYVDNFQGLNSLSGKFSGNLDEKKKTGFINMNPKLADNNIFLNFKIYSDSLSGTWIYSTMAGVKNRGNFIATKLKQ